MIRWSDERENQFEAPEPSQEELVEAGRRVMRISLQVGLRTLVEFVVLTVLFGSLFIGPEWRNVLASAGIVFGVLAMAAGGVLMLAGLREIFR